MYHPPDGHNKGKGSRTTDYVVVIGNMSKVFGPYDYADAAAIVARYTPGSGTYAPGRWDGYSVQLARLDFEEVSK